MADSQTQMHNFARAIKISLMGKSTEAKGGASIVVQNLLQYANGLDSKDRTFEAMLEILNLLKKEVSA